MNLETNGCKFELQSDQVLSFFITFSVWHSIDLDCFQVAYSSLTTLFCPNSYLLLTYSDRIRCLGCAALWWSRCLLTQFPFAAKILRLVTHRSTDRLEV